MDLRDSFTDAVGRTPLLKLRKASELTGCTILGKAEFLNPGGSVKDRAAKYIVLDAEERGVLRKGGVIVEGTAGNTGIGLALVGRALGVQVVTVMPARYSPEKADLARALGAEVDLVAGERAGMRECIERARRLAAERGGLVLDQFQNAANPAIHELTTGPELWAHCEGRVDAVVLGVGTGGTFTGVTRFLRARSPNVMAFAVESQGSVLGGKVPRPTRVEGIGNLFVPGTFDRSLAEEIIAVDDDDAFATARELARCDGILAGPSSGAIVHAALRLASRLGPGRRVATLVADGGERYCSRGLYAPTRD